MGWIQRNVLRLTDDEIKVMQKEIDKEKEAGLILDPMQIAQQAQTDLSQGTGGTASGPAPQSADAAPPSGPSESAGSSGPKGDLSLNNEYIPPFKMLNRILSDK